MDLDLNKYKEILKRTKNLIPCIKKFNKEEIKINEKYIDVENLSVQDIIPYLYEEKDEDIKSLEKSLEDSIDKTFGKYYEKTNGKFYNNKNDNKAKNLFKKKKEELCEEIDKENEEYKMGDIKEIHLIEYEEEQDEGNNNLLIYNKKYK